MPWPHFTPGKDPLPILQEAVWVSGPVWTGGKSCPHWDSILDCPVCSAFIYTIYFSAPWTLLLRVAASLTPLPQLHPCPSHKNTGSLKESTFRSTRFVWKSLHPEGWYTRHDTLQFYQSWGINTFTGGSFSDIISQVLQSSSPGNFAQRDCKSSWMFCGEGWSSLLLLAIPRFLSWILKTVRTAQMITKTKSILV